MELYNQNTDIFKILSETQNSTFQTIQSVTNPVSQHSVETSIAFVYDDTPEPKWTLIYLSLCQVVSTSTLFWSKCINTGKLPDIFHTSWILPKSLSFWLQATFPA